MFKHLRGERSYLICPNKKKKEYYKLIRSTLSAGIVQDMFAGEAEESEGGKEEITGGYFYRYFYSSG